jgi:hypothetical protein
MNRIEISISKRKMIISLMGCLAFVLAGFLFVLQPSTFAGKTVVRSSSMIMIVGVLSILFFGLCGYFIAKKLFTKTPGLIIDDKGISDHSSGIEAGFIPWHDIKEIGTFKILKQQFVTVLLKDPQKYIDAESNAAKKKVMQANLRSAGTPYCISTNTLNIKFKALHALLAERLQQSR